MIYSKKQIEQYASESGFIKMTLEKVVRLLDVLDFIFSKSNFKGKLVLKGGTAINLVYTNLKRLSVDIDLDYCGSLDREETFKDREIIVQELDKYMIKEKYEISQNSRNSAALISRIYKYKNAFNNNDAIKVDINFMNRVHLYPVRIDTITYFDKTVTLRTPSIEELFGMKINALLDRSKPRDLYDSYYLISNINLFDKDMLRKAALFYFSLNGKYVLNDSTLNKIRTITWKDIKKEILPVIKKSERFDLEEVTDKVLSMLPIILTLDTQEKEYLDDFSKGNYKPSLLFDELIASKIENHPMAKWRIMNIKK